MLSVYLSDGPAPTGLDDRADCEWGKNLLLGMTLDPHSVLKGVHWVKDKHFYQQTNSIFNSGQNTFLRSKYKQKQCIFIFYLIYKVI